MEWQDLIILAFCLLGSIHFVKPIVSMCKWFLVFHLRKPSNLQDYGSWVVITGCTDGIGKAMAFDLASCGLNLVLVGRNPSKLKATSDEIRKRHGADIKIESIVLDLAKVRGEEIARTIEGAVEGLDVGILINNAGLGNPGGSPVYFHEHGLEFIADMLRVNVEAATWVIKGVLPGMMKRKSGVIVNMGSASTYFLPNFPLASAYAGTKEYLSMLSRSLSLEYKQHGINVQCQVIGMVETKMLAIDRTFANSFFMPLPEVFSKASVRSIGCKSLCTPYWRHYLLWNLVDLLPEPVLSWCMFKHVSQIREADLEKLKLTSIQGKNQ